MSLLEAWRDARWSRLPERRFCRLLDLEGWITLGEPPLLVLVPRRGCWRCAVRALTLYRQALTLDAGVPDWVEAARAGLEAGSTVALLGAEALPPALEGRPSRTLGALVHRGRLRMVVRG